MASYTQKENLKPFDGSGFSNWEFRLKLLLEQNNILDVLENVRVGDDFKKKDTRARNIIVQWLDDSVLDTVKESKTAKQMFEALKNTYTKKGLSIQVDLQRKIRNMKFVDGNLQEFITNFEKTISELRASGGKIDDSEIIAQLLSAMPESFQAITTSIDVIFTQNPSEITVQFVKNKLLQEEMRKQNNESGNNNNTDSVAFYGRNSGSYRGRGTGKFKNILKQNSLKSNTSENSRFRFKCYRCGKLGHKRIDCRVRLANVTEAEEEQNEVTFVADVMSATNDFSFENEKNAIKDTITFIVDSGATNHLIKRSAGNYLKEEKSVDVSINVAKKGTAIKAQKSGNLYLENSNGLHFKIKNVLLCEELNYNLLSVNRIEKEGYKLIFEEEKVKIICRKSNKVLIEGFLKGNLYMITFKLRSCSVNVTCDENQMHSRMGHSYLYPPKSLCEVCLKGKQTRATFKSIPEEKRATRLLEVVSSDVAGPIAPPTYDNMRYYVVFIDHYSHFTQLYLMKEKSEVFQKFKDYEALVTAKFHAKISRLRCDNGGEYTSNTFKKFCKEKGIQIQYTVPRNPEQNGVSERFNRTVMNMARCMLLESKVSKSFWGEALRAASYTINRLASSVLSDNKSPANVWYNQHVSLDNMRMFGCTGYVHVPKEDRGKLDERSKKMYLMGYASNGYRMWDPISKKIIIARSVIFDERIKDKDAKSIQMEKNELENKTEKIERDQLDQNIRLENSRRGSRTRKLPLKFQDYDINFMAALSTGCLPSENSTNYDEAMKIGAWDDAIQEELNNLKESKTRDIVLASKTENIIDSKWVFTQKKVNGKTQKKARLVARGFLQNDCDLHEEIYTPVARMVTLRVLLSIAVEQDHYINQMDVKAAFLNGVLKEPVYMYHPPRTKFDYFKRSIGITVIS